MPVNFGFPFFFPECWEEPITSAIGRQTMTWQLSMLPSDFVYRKNAAEQSIGNAKQKGVFAADGELK